MSTQTAPRPGARVHVQKFGTFLSNMIMPNIPALIAWGLLTALFIDVGWWPNADLATMVGPDDPLPAADPDRRHRWSHGVRRPGRRRGRLRVMGAIAGSDLLIAEFNAVELAEWLADGNAAEDFSALGQVHMFIGAMIIGPLAAWVMKRLDALWDGQGRAPASRCSSTCSRPASRAS